MPGQIVYDIIYGNKYLYPINKTNLPGTIMSVYGFYYFEFILRFVPNDNSLRFSNYNYNVNIFHR